jgi:hypothetical protein
VLVLARDAGGVREVEVAQLACEGRVRRHEVDPARPDGPSVQGNLPDVFRVLRRVAARPADPKDVGRVGRDVLDGDRDALSLGVCEVQPSSG